MIQLDQINATAPAVNDTTGPWFGLRAAMCFDIVEPLVSTGC